MAKPLRQRLLKTVSKFNAPQRDYKQFTQTNRKGPRSLPKHEGQISIIIKNLQQNIKNLKHFKQGLKRSQSQCSKKFTFSHNNKLRKQIENTQKCYQNRKSTKKQPNTLEKSKNQFFLQNGSTMMSFHHGDIDEIKKAYFHNNRKQTSNIVDLYNFYKQNIEKSTRILGSMEYSNCLMNKEHSEETMYGNRISTLNNNKYQNNNQILNVIIEDTKQKVQNNKQNCIKCSNHQNLEKQSNNIQFQKNSKTVQQNRQSDMEKAIQFVKAKRPSTNTVKSYIRPKSLLKQNFKNKQLNQLLNIKQKYNLSTKNINKNNKLQQNIGPFVNHEQEKMININAFQVVKQMNNERNPKLSFKNHLQKTINQKQNQQNYGTNQMNSLSRQKNSQQILKKSNQEIIIKPLEKIDAQTKFKNSKFFVTEIPLKKQNIKSPISLSNCSISKKSTSRIIDLDFLQLDL